MSVADRHQSFFVLECSGCQQRKRTQHRRQFEYTRCQTRTTLVPRCIFEIALADESGSTTGVITGNVAEQLLGATADTIFQTTCIKGHWRFPGGKEMQGYAYILTHPGTPSVFFDHIFSGYRSEVGSLISLRKRNKINCRSMVEITKAERDVYAAVIDDKVAIKIGPGHYEPPSGHQRWKIAAEGNDYKVWELS